MIILSGRVHREEHEARVEEFVRLLGGDVDRVPDTASINTVPPPG